MNIRYFCTIALSLALLTIMPGCTTGGTPVAGKALDSLNGKSAATEERLSTAASAAIAEGKTNEALALYERLYLHGATGIFTESNAKRQEIALNYAQLLRKTGKAQRAITVLAPFMAINPKNREKTTDPIILNEYAASSIELGNFVKAEEVLNQVLEDKNASGFHADAYNLLGIVLDAQGQHKEAEQSFRQSLSTWKGDPTSVMNNLAVCLASQGMFDESLATLRQALLMAPDKKEIAHNIQMVSELRQSLLPKPKAPVDIKKKKPAAKKNKKK